MEKIGGVNGPLDWAFGSAESIRFHVVTKGIIRNVLQFVKVPDTYFTNLRPRDETVFNIIREYEDNEEQSLRKDIISVVARFAFSLYLYDYNYHEVFEWFMWKFKEIEVETDPWIRDPENWFKDGRGRKYPPNMPVFRPVKEDEKS